jgi:hypothetical protein
LASSIGSSNFRDQDMKAGYSGYSPQIIRHYGVFASNNRAESIATTPHSSMSPRPPLPQKHPDVAADTPRVLPAHARAAALA